jgi:pimeloyl-ACP methyl ester carboxylesterase
VTHEVESAVASPAGVRLAVRQSGSPGGHPVVLLHGITMTRDYVLMGSTELEENGYRVIAYDARGHGRSTAPDDHTAYGYDELLADLLAVLDAFEVERAVLVGSSMGCHTAIRLALDHPERVAAIVAITPAYDPVTHPNEADVRDADRLGEAMRTGGADGYIAGLKDMGDPAVAMTFLSLTRRRLAQHRDLTAVADALQANLRARPFASFDELAVIRVPSLVVASRDELDPRHPYELARSYAAAIPDCDCVSEPEGRAPLAWNGRKLARRVVDVASHAHYLTNRDPLSTLPSPGS